mmetsp:Transcript_11795/g.26732  ORF Transcript_11795/g.26732 Transcript_11795/m.26732 type:complete len:85 (-) Transcript_11795:14-268(-)
MEGRLAPPGRAIAAATWWAWNFRWKTIILAYAGSHAHGLAPLGQARLQLMLAEMFTPMPAAKLLRIGCQQRMLCPVADLYCLAA